MSFKVLVIPEDPTLNGYILKPLAEAILADAGKPRAKVTVLSNPRLEGYDHAVRAIKEELPNRYSFWDVWLFMPDADRASAAAMVKLEKELAAKGVNLFCCPAKPEVEIYPCVAFRADLKAHWDAIRKSERMKEDYFFPLLEKNGDPRRAGGGRDLMIEKSLQNLTTLYQLCPELGELKQRLQAHLTQA